MTAEFHSLVLIIEAPNGDVREVPLGLDAIVIGRDESADIRVDDKRVSRRHASFKMIDDAPWVEDLGSANGVRLNGDKIVKRARFTERDRIRVGGFFVTLRKSDGASRASEPASSNGQAPKERRVVEKASKKKNLENEPHLVGRSEPVKKAVFAIRPGENVIGRLEECDIPILDGSVSRQHARLTLSKEKLTLTDLDSANGVFVNNVQVEAAELDPGDELRVGSVRFDVRLPASFGVRPRRPVKSRSRRAAHRNRAGRSWQVGVGASLFVAAFLVAGTLYWQLSKSGGVAGSASTLAAPAPTRLSPASTREADAIQVAESPSSPTPGVAAPSPPPTVPRSPTAAVAPPPVPASSDGSASDLTSAAIREASLSELGLIATATSPFSPRGANGLPENLPPVDPSFRFEAFVQAGLAKAEACAAKSDFLCVRTETEELLERDPVNAAAKALLMKAKAFDAAEQTLARAARLEARREYGEAYRLLASISKDMPQVQDARKLRKKIEKLAIDDELERAAEESRRRATYERAHERYQAVLGIRRNSKEAIEGLRRLERRMMRAQMRFTPYEPPHAKRKGPRTPDEVAKAIRRFYDGNGQLADIAAEYARGALDKAQRSARTLSKRGKAAERRGASKLLRSIKDLEGRYERTRTEISNDPERAWSMLVELRERERNVLPASVRSFLTRELEIGLSEAFAQRGASMYDRGRFEEAFRAWESGYKLDATHPKVLAGMKKLETQATQLLQEAELAAQRGQPDTCERYKRITRMTRGTSEVHRGARKRAFEVCS